MLSPSAGIRTNPQGLLLALPLSLRGTFEKKGAAGFALALHSVARHWAEVPAVT